MWNTGQIQGKLSRVMRYANPELNSGTEPDKCAEARSSASFKQDDGMVHSIMKVVGLNVSRIPCLSSWPRVFYS